MANDKKMVEAITSMDEDFAQWYTDRIYQRKGMYGYQACRICNLGAYTEAA